MQSLSDLNGYSDTEIEVTDNRLAKVLFDRAEPTLQEINITSVTVPVTQGFEIEEIINYSTADCRYQIKIQSTSSTFISGSTIAFPTLPTGVTLATSSTTFEKTYTLSGINRVSDWDQVKAATWTLAAGYASVDTFNLEVSVVYYNEELGSDIRFAYLIYDPDFYYDVKLDSVFSVTADVVNFRPFTVAITSQFTLFAETIDYEIDAEFSLACQALRIKNTSATLASTTSIVCNNLLVVRVSATINASTGMTTIPSTFRRYYFAIGSTVSNGSSRFYGVNYFKIQDTVEMIPSSAWTTDNNYQTPQHGMIADDVAGGIITTVESNSISGSTLLTKYDLNGETPQRLTSVSVPRTQQMIDDGEYYVDTDFATGRVTDTYSAFIGSSEIPYSSQLMLYNKNLTLQQNYELTHNGNAVQVGSAHWDSTLTYLTVSYYAWQETSTTNRIGIRGYKRSGNTLTLIMNENPTNKSFAPTATVNTIRRPHHATNDAGTVLFLVNRTYTLNGVDYVVIDRFTRSGDFYTYRGGSAFGGIDIQSMAVKDNFLAVTIRQSSSVPAGDSTLLILTFDSVATLTSRAQMTVKALNRSLQSNALAWTDDAAYLIYGSSVDINFTPGVSNPLRVWSRATYTFTEQTVNYGSEAWPTITLEGQTNSIHDIESWK